MANTLGIDCSVWQDDNSTAQMMDFAKAMEAGARFVFIKASQGGLLDQDYVNNWLHAEGLLLRGAYHFYDWWIPYQTQVDLFCRIVENDPGELPPALDYEMRTNAPHASLAVSYCLRFLREVEQRTGKTPILYTSPGFWGEFGANLPALEPYPLWIAHYGAWLGPSVPKPWKKWTFWQYSCKGDGLKFGAESKSLDLNWFNGTEEELRAMCGVETDPTEPGGSETLPYKVVVVTALWGLRVREEPNTSSRILKSLRYGTKVKVEIGTGDPTDRPYAGWLKLAEEPGWISGEWVK